MIHIVYRLEQQKEEEIEKVKHKLQWATHPRRTLTVKEFFHAIASSEYLYAKQPNPSHVEDAVIPHTYLEGVRTTLSSSCGGFLEVQAPQSESGHFDPDTFLVQLIHDSVRTFLGKKKAGPFQMVKQECNLKLTASCIQYLRLSLVHSRSTQEVAFMEHLGCHPLLAYIWAELPTHLRDLNQTDLVESLEELTSLLEELRCIDPSHPGFLILHTWIFRLLAQMPSSQNPTQQWKAKTRSYLIESNDKKLDLQMFLRTIVVAAIEANNFSAFRIICGAGALDYDDENLILSAILETAAKTDSSAFLEFIGDCRTVIEAVSSTALRHAFTEGLETACDNGYEAVTKWFLERGVIEGTKDQGCTALSLAVNAGHYSVVKLLLDYGINPHYKRSNARSLLSIAAEKGYEKVVLVLLKFDVDPDSRDDQGRTPLSMALSAGHEAFVKILLTLKGEDVFMPRIR